MIDWILKQCPEAYSILEDPSTWGGGPNRIRRGIGDVPHSARVESEGPKPAEVSELGEPEGDSGL